MKITRYFCNLQAEPSAMDPGVPAWGETPPSSKRQHDSTGALISTDARGPRQGLDCRLQRSIFILFCLSNQPGEAVPEGKSCPDQGAFLLLSLQYRMRKWMASYMSTEPDSECLPPDCKGHSSTPHTQSNGVPHPWREVALANILSTSK